MKKIAIIGGSGLEDPAILKDVNEITVDTPYGAPSSTFKCGKIDGVDVVILSRHGRDHSIPPTLVNNRANIWAIKHLGCSCIIATTACGSLRLEIGRGEIVFPHQFIDFTRFRKSTFVESFENGNLDHPAMSEPFSWKLRQRLIENAKELDLGFHKTGTVITIEGPRFSTRAESNMFRIWGADVINMSTAPECALANEVNLPYAAIALSTDYDSWNIDEAPVTWEEVLKVFNENVENVIKLLANTIASFKKV